MHRADRLFSSLPASGDRSEESRERGHVPYRSGVVRVVSTLLPLVAAWPRIVCTASFAPPNYRGRSSTARVWLSSRTG